MSEDIEKEKNTWFIKKIKEKIDNKNFKKVFKEQKIQQIYYFIFNNKMKKIKLKKISNNNHKFFKNSLEILLKILSS